MSNIKIELNREGVGELLKTGMLPIVEEYAKQIADRCGDGYEYDTYVGTTRCNAMVWADTPEAKKDNEENNIILGALMQ